MPVTQPASNRTTFEKYLRTVYDPKIKQQFAYRNLLYQTFRKRERKIAPGKKFTQQLHIGAGEGISWSSRGVLPPAGYQESEEATFNHTQCGFRLEIDEALIEDAKGMAAAPEDPLQFEMRHKVLAARHDFSFDMYGDGSGKLANVASSASATTFVVDTVRGLRHGMRVGVLLKSNGSAGAGGVASARIAVNKDTKTVTLLGGAQLADGSGTELNGNATLYGVYRHGSYNDAIFGLQAIVSNANPSVGNYGGIDRTDANKDWWKAHVFGNSGTPRALTLKMIQDAIDAIEINSAEGNAALILCENQIWSHVVDLLDGNRRYGGTQMTLNGWAKAVEFGTTPIVKDPQCPAGKMFILDPMSFTLSCNGPGSWMDKDGAILSRIDGKTAYEAAWYLRCQLICDAPNANAVIEDLQYTAPS